MITRINPEHNKESWQLELARAISDPAELFKRLHLDTAKLPASLIAHKDFRLRVTDSYLRCIEPGNPNDPLLLQVLPQGLEVNQSPGDFLLDPVGDADATQTPGLIHKYHGRVLLVTTGACAIHCRYCFRRHFPYSESSAGRDLWQQALAYLAGQPDVDEVILSGGDPLTLSDEKLESLVQQLEAIPHIKTLRVHSRLPIVLPSRVTPTLLDLLENTRLKTVIVVHSNHANELSTAVGDALRQLKQRHFTLLNQAVLLKNVNNDVFTLKTLSKSLFDHGVLPYYLHVLDKVAGAAHFDIADHDAQQLVEALRQQLPGYLVPKLVRETSGEASKTPL